MVMDGRVAAGSDGRPFDRSDGRRRGGASLLLPSDVAGLRSWYDGFDSAVYDSTPELVRIVDKGPDANDMVPDAVGLPQSLVTVGSTSVPLPGPASSSLPTTHPEVVLNESLGDFTVMALIPSGQTQATTSTYFAFQTTAGAGFYAFQLKQSTTPGAIEVAGGPSIDVGFDNGAGPGAHAIVFARRSVLGNALTLDAWYDKRLGAGVVKPAQVVAADPLAQPIVLTGAAVGGRGGATFFWPGPIHMVAWWNRVLDYADVVGLAQGAGARLGFAGVA